MCWELTGEESRPSKSKIFKECFTRDGKSQVGGFRYVLIFTPNSLGKFDPQFFTHLFFSEWG